MQPKIIQYSSQYKKDLLEISLEWLNKYNILEDIDIQMLTHPDEIIQNGGYILLSLDEDLRATGLVMLENNDDSFDILKLGVRKEAQGQGIATCLMNAAIEIAKLSKKSKLTLCSNHQLVAALHIYEKLGFQYITYTQNHFALSDISMELIL